MVSRSILNTVRRVLVLAIALVAVMPVAGPISARSAAQAPSGQPALPDLDVKPGQFAAEWQPAGSLYEVTPIYALALGPSPEVLYAGTWGEGLYRSDDAGLTWHPTSQETAPEGMENLADAQVHELLVMPDGETIYMSPWGRSLWRSQDGGATWDPAGMVMPFNNALNVDALVLDRDDPNVLYQGTWGGVHKSEDGGETWALKDVDEELAPGQKEIYDLIQDADGTLYAGTVGAGVYRSTDRADHWHKFGLQELDPASKVFSLVARQGTLWAGTPDGVYRRRAGEEEWTPVNEGIDLDARTVQVLALDDRGGLYAGTVDYGVYHSIDDGETWESYSAPWSIVSMLYDASTHSLYVGTASGDGIHRHDGTDWEAINEELPVIAYPVQSLAFAGRERDQLLVGTWAGGMYRSGDRGQSWSRVRGALPVGLARDVPDIVVIEEGRIVVLAAGTGIRRSEDYGQSWYWATSGLPEEEHRVRCLAQGHRDPKLLFALLELQDGFGIYRSTDGGSEWQFHSTLTGVYDLALSGDDKTLLAAQLGEGILYSSSEVDNWQEEPLGEDIVPHGVQIVAREGNAWQRLVLGLESQSLHVRALNGLYSSFDGGKSWRATLPGQFETVMADPTRPGVLYATSMTYTVPLPDVVTQPAAFPNAFWVSRDDGRSWTQASSSDRSLTALALYPRDHSRLYAGTSDGGVYYTTLRIPSAYATARAMAGLAVFVIAPGLVLIGLIAMYLNFRLKLRLRLYPWQVWAVLLYPRVWRMLSTPRSVLDPLDRLVASVAAELPAPFTVETVWTELQNRGVSSSPTEVDAALSRLLGHHLLVQDRKEGYRFALVVLAQLANLRWESETLVDLVRNAELVARDAEAFFKQVGFRVVALPRRLSLWSGSPQYRGLGRLNAWLHIHERLDEASVAKLRDGADGSGDGLGFVVLDEMPTAGAYRAMQAAHLVPLSSSEIHRAVVRHEAGLALERFMREGQGQTDLFDWREPVLDHLVLFGRAQTLNGWLADIERGRRVFFWGLPRSGRTSTLWWLRAKTPSHWLCGYVSLRPRLQDWRLVVRDLMADVLTNLQRMPSPLLALPDLDQVLAVCGPDKDLGAGLDYLADQVPWAGGRRFVLFVDNATPGRTLDRLFALADGQRDLSLVVSWAGMPSMSEAAKENTWLGPLSSDESRVLLETVGARLGITFDQEDVDVLDQAAGGHPFLLRQLGSQVARMAGRPSKESVQVRRLGEGPGQLPPVQFPAPDAIRTYLEQRSDVMDRFWQSFHPEVRRNVRLLIAGQAIDPGLEPAYTALGLMKRDPDDGQHLRIGLLGRWLQERWS